MERKLYMYIGICFIAYFALVFAEIISQKMGFRFDVPYLDSYLVATAEWMERMGNWIRSMVFG